jgi:hypothetical protein
MTIPAFTAELSIGDPIGRYAGRSFSNPSMSAGIRPQLRIGGLGVTNDCCCTTASGGKTCLDGGCESDCSCGCSDGTPICVCRALTSSGFRPWRV